MVPATLNVSPSTHGLDRLDFQDDPVAQWSGELEAMWSTVEAAVKKVDSGVQSHRGSNVAAAWELFSYCVFTHPNYADVDPVVAGVTILRDGGDMRLHADVSGESNGDIIAEVCARPIQREFTRFVVDHLQTKFMGLAERIVQAVRDKQRLVN